MVNEIELKLANNSYRADIVSLLQSENLPANDLPAELDNFLVAVDNDLVIAAVGLERYENCGLLRSLVVNPSYRNQNIAGELINRLESNAMASGIDCIYLLTETAPNYFERKGYLIITRTAVPDVLLKSSEFSHVCPASAIVMKKSI
jgi:amino-acid N-acetyltransferase